MDKKFVVNIGRELGSGGRDIGKIVADMLGIDFYDKRLLEVAAIKSGISSDVFEKADEHGRQTPLSTLVSYLRNPFAGGEGQDDNPLSAQRLFAIQSEVIRDVASHGSALFVGRCADYILRDYPNVINIFITANRPERIAQISELCQVDWSAAERMIDKCDISRAEYYNFYSTGQWGHASSYHLCINSSHLGAQRTAEFIVEYVKQRVK